MVALEMDQDMNDKLDNLAEKIGDVRSAQRVSTEAFSRHEVSNQKDFQIITKELEHANEATHEMGAVAKERNAEVMAAVKDVKKDVADWARRWSASKTWCSGSVASAALYSSSSITGRRSPTS
jgi:hypothetical protein